MKMSSLLMLVPVLFLSVACGGKTSSTGPKHIKLTQSQIDDVMDNQNVTCASIGFKSCPEGVSRLFTINPQAAEQSTVCTGFMVDKKTLVTNYHCLSTAAQCANTHLAIYDGHSYVRSKCKKIIKTKQDYSDANDSRRAIDFTVMEIADEFTGDTFKVATDKAEVDEKITAWVVDHTGLDLEDANPYDFRITEFSCKVADQTSSKSLILNKCPVVHGNSGSPAVNSAGEIIGVIWGATALSIDSSYDLSARRNLSEDAVVTEMFQFSPYLPVVKEKAI